MKNFIKYKSHVVFDVVCENHLAIFYPLPFFELDVINMVIGDSFCKQYCQMLFHWIELNSLTDKEFMKKHISAFDNQIISRNAKKLTQNLLGDQDR